MTRYDLLKKDYDNLLVHVGDVLKAQTECERIDALFDLKNLYLVLIEGNEAVKR